MKKRVGNLKKTKLLILLALAFSFISSTTAFEEGLCVEDYITDISPTSIKVGDEFTIGLKIENCGSIVPEFVSFELLNPPTEIEIKEPLSLNISKINYANSERFVLYHMKTKSTASPGTYLIKTRLTYGTKFQSLTKEKNITFKVTGEKAEIGIASIKTTPILPYEGDMVELTLRIENVGKGDAKSIKVYTEYPFKGTKQSFIGKLASDEDGPAIFTFIAEKAGEFEIPLIIKYIDDFGEKEVKSEIKLTILEKKKDTKTIILAILVLLVIICETIYFIRANRKKDKIIRQLLKNGNSVERNRR